jgi:hypothetical protein
MLEKEAIWYPLLFIIRCKKLYELVSNTLITCFMYMRIYSLNYF